MIFNCSLFLLFAKPRQNYILEKVHPLMTLKHPKTIQNKTFTLSCQKVFIVRSALAQIFDLFYMFWLILLYQCWHSSAQCFPQGTRSCLLSLHEYHGSTYLNSCSSDFTEVISGLWSWFLLLNYSLPNKELLQLDSNFIQQLWKMILYFESGVQIQITGLLWLSISQFLIAC